MCSRSWIADIISTFANVGMSTLYDAISRGDSIGDIARVLDLGTDDINAVGGEYGTALGAAAYWGRVNVISLLLDQGADINVVGGSYGTALGAAVFRERVNAISLLLNQGADVNADRKSVV